MIDTDTSGQRPSGRYPARGWASTVSSTSAATCSRCWRTVFRLSTLRGSVVSAAVVSRTVTVRVASPPGRRTPVVGCTAYPSPATPRSTRLIDYDRQRVCAWRACRTASAAQVRRRAVVCRAVVLRSRSGLRRGVRTVPVSGPGTTRNHWSSVVPSVRRGQGSANRHPRQNGTCPGADPISDPAMPPNPVTPVDHDFDPNASATSNPANTPFCSGATRRAKGFGLSAGHGSEVGAGRQGA